MGLEIVEAMDGGRAFCVEAATAGRCFRGIVPRELLDDEISVSARQHDREEWIRKHASEIEAALKVRQKASGFTRRPFDRVALSEVL